MRLDVELRYTIFALPTISGIESHGLLNNERDTTVSLVLFHQMIKYVG